MAGKLLETAVEGTKTSHSFKGGPGQYDGCKGMPERTKSSNAVPEKTLDYEGGLPGKDGK